MKEQNTSALLKLRTDLEFFCSFLKGSVSYRTCRRSTRSHGSIDGSFYRDRKEQVHTSQAFRRCTLPLQSCVMIYLPISRHLLLLIQLTSLALKLAPGQPSRWPDWIISCISAFSSQGASPEYIHDFLSIVAEEVGNADLLGSSKYVIAFLLLWQTSGVAYFCILRVQMQQMITDSSSMVVQAITATITQPLGTAPTSQYLSALRCLQAWLSFLRAE